MIIKLEDIPCPSCSTPGAKRMGVQPEGLHVEMECQVCALAWSVSG